MDAKIRANQQAATSFTSKAKKISKGKSKTRVSFNNSDNSSLFIAAKSSKSRVFTYFAVASGKYAAVTIADQKMLLSVNSIAKRLHIAKNEVLNDSKTANFLETISEKALVTEQVLDNYNEIVKDQFLASKSHKKPLVHLSGRTTTLSKELVMKVIRVTLDKEIGDAAVVESSLLITTHREKGKVDFQWIGKEIGSGASAKIFNIEGDQEVYKWPDRNSLNKLGNVEEEVQIVKKLNENGPQDGISLPMHLVHCISPQNNSDSLDYGLLMPRYDQDYNAVCPPKEIPLTALNQEEIVKIIFEFEKLLSGLSYMHNQGILHGDIKPANILQKGDRTDIIDFGGARDSTISSVDPKEGTAYYMHFNDIEVFNKAKEANDLDLMITIEKSKDVFALGTTFYERFQENTPFKDQFSGKQDGIERNPLPGFVPQEIVQLIEAMTNHEYNQRLTAEQALLQLRAYKLNLLTN